MKRSSKLVYQIGLLFSSIPFLISLPFFGFGVYKVVDTYIKLQGTIETEGMVVDNDLELFADGGSAYVPVVRFTSESGEIVRFTDSVGSIPPAYEEGEKVKVLYHPDDPKEAYIKTWFRLWFGSVIWLLVGILPVTIDQIVQRVAYKQMKERFKSESKYS